MMEVLWALAVLLMLGGVAAIQHVPWGDLIEFGQSFMLGSAALGIPLELAYFALLARAVAKHPECPRGWYWRSFAQHPLLTRRQRRYVLPLFYAGALAFLGIAMGIVLVLLAFIAAAH